MDKKAVNSVFEERMNAGLRYDSGKLRFDLLPPEPVIHAVGVLTDGASKYADRNWELGMPWSKVIGPMFRHIFKWLCGERYDEETGRPHLAHVIVNAMFLLTYEERGLGIDDRAKPAPHMIKLLNGARAVAPPPSDPVAEGDYQGSFGLPVDAPQFARTASLRS